MSRSKRTGLFGTAGNIWLEDAVLRDRDLSVENRQCRAELDLVPLVLSGYLDWPDKLEGEDGVRWSWDGCTRWQSHEAGRTRGPGPMK